VSRENREELDKEKKRNIKPIIATAAAAHVPLR
jgi:hypothetical protein